MNILGISAPISWNAAAAIVKDGTFLACAEEERFVRIKHAPRIVPFKSIEWCLSYAQLRPEQIDAVVLGFRGPWSMYTRSFLENIKERDLRRAIREGGAFAEYLVRMVRLKEWMAQKGFRTSGSNQVTIKFYPHHVTHAASAYRCSGFPATNVITLDGQGEDDSGYLGFGENSRMWRTEKIGHHQSIGWAYSEATTLLGFLSHSDEGKVMGLAGYGQNILDTSGIFHTYEDGYKLNHRWHGRFFARFGPQRQDKEPLNDHHRDVALTVQRFQEAVGVGLAKRLYKKTGNGYFCLAGGSALNCDMNQKIRDLPFAQEVFIQPASNDSGTAIGAALEYANHVGENADFEMRHAYWGPEYSNADIEEVLLSTKLAYERSDDIEQEVAEAIAAGKIVAWMQGRAEIGPRALGNRSILAHPGLVGMKDKLNQEVKHRETWRPFGPSVLHEHGDDYFENYTFAPFMILTFDCKPKAKKDFSQVVHIDNTARVQSVEAQTNPRYYRLISKFAAITGIPGVINTSFNDNNEPMVLSPKDALRCFAGTGIDILAMGDFIVRKQRQSLTPSRDDIQQVTGVLV